MMDKKELCKAAMSLRCTEITQWEAGFLHGACFGVNGVPDEFYARLQDKLPKDKE